MSQPSKEDLVAPFDPTGYTTINGAMLLQLINGSAPYADKGLIMITSDVAGVPQVPDAVTNTKWQRNMWLRLSAASVGTYVWNPAASSDPTYLQWQSTNIAGIAPGSIVNSMIADNTILDVKIANLSYSKLIGAPTGLPPSGAAGGSLTGTYPNPSIGNGVVTDAMMVAKTLTNASIANKTITFGLLASDNAAGDMLRVQTADSTIVEWFTPPKILMAGGNALELNIATSQLKVLQVNAGGTGYQYTSPQSLLSRFTSPAVALSAGSQLISAAHGLGAIPFDVRGVLICGVTADAGYQNEEVNIGAFFAPVTSGGITVYQPAFSASATVANVNMAQAVSNGSVVNVIHKTTGALTAITAARWTAKVYAQL